MRTDHRLRRSGFFENGSVMWLMLQAGTRSELQAARRRNHESQLALPPWAGGDNFMFHHMRATRKSAYRQYSAKQIDVSGANMSASFMIHHCG
jgi:hypothetical protein